jgi:hypothetical protein
LQIKVASVSQDWKSVMDLNHQTIIAVNVFLTVYTVKKSKKHFVENLKITVYFW